MTVTVENGNVYGVKGEADVYPCLVAHTDTVHDIVPKNEYQVLRQDSFLFGWNPVRNTFTGVGGDDKVGIFLALSALAEYDAFKVAFFRDEEIGCVGSGLANMEFFKDCAFVLQGDRRGNDDFVNSIYGSSLYSWEFKKAIEPFLNKYGYKETSGALTDVYELTTKGVGLCVANFSCGYYNPHTAKEFIDVDDVQNILGLVLTIINELGDRQWVHKSTKSYNNYSSYGGNTRSRSVKQKNHSLWDYDDDEYESYRYGYGDSDYINRFGHDRNGEDKALADVGTWAGKGKRSEAIFMPDGGFGDVTLTADGCCPYCQLDDMLMVDPYLDQWVCDRCNEWLGTAMGF